MGDWARGGGRGKCVGVAKRVGEGSVRRLFRFYELARRGLRLNYDMDHHND